MNGMAKTPTLDLIAFLSAQGLRRTPQRLQILEALQGAETPLSAEEIHSRLKGLSCDPATVYRNLTQLAEHQLLEKTFFSDQVARYRLKALHSKHHSHHIECRECHEVTEIDRCLLDQQLKTLEKMGFQKISHRLEFQAICPKCL